MNQYLEQIEHAMPCAVTGSVTRTEGLVVHAAGFNAPVGAVVEIERQAGDPLEGEVVGFRDGCCVIFPYEEVRGIRQKSRIRLKKTSRRFPVSDRLLGRVVDAHGNAVDSKGGVPGFQRVPLDRRPPDPVSRPTIDRSLSTGIRAMDGFLTCGLGQRMGIFAGAGVGKSVLLGMMARNSSADVNVIALIGERGREVNEFIHRDLGPEGLARSAVVLATSDQPALMRVQAAMAATAVAEYFRDQGKNVLLIMDSLTRVAIAQREIGLASGEPPATRGYPPSVFALLPRLVERAGRSELGSITAYYSVLVEGDDASEPIADSVRGLIDGHTMLSRDIAGQGHYPAIDILQSISRLMNEIVDDSHRESAMKLRRLMSVYRDHQDLISIGAYRTGSNPEVDQAIAARDVIQQYLAQGMNETSTLEASREEIIRLATELVT